MCKAPQFITELNFRIIQIGQNDETRTNTKILAAVSLPLLQGKPTKSIKFMESNKRSLSSSFEQHKINMWVKNDNAVGYILRHETESQSANICCQTVINLYSSSTYLYK